MKNAGANVPRTYNLVKWFFTRLSCYAALVSHNLGCQGHFALPPKPEWYRMRSTRLRRFLALSWRVQYNRGVDIPPRIMGACDDIALPLFCCRRFFSSSFHMFILFCFFPRTCKGFDGSSSARVKIIPEKHYRTSGEMPPSEPPNCWQTQRLGKLRATLMGAASFWGKYSEEAKCWSFRLPYTDHSKIKWQVYFCVWTWDK